MAIRAPPKRLTCSAFSVARETAALASTPAGLNLLAFTGGIGEHAPAARAAIDERLGWLGVDIAFDANGDGAARIDARGAVEVRIVPTDEESVTGIHTLACCGRAKPPVRHLRC